jgi:glycine cleavage system P protein (glycine dehydrogenase) subunit 1
MHYTEGERAIELMLGEMGLRSTDDLFKDVPASVRATLALPKGVSEMEVRRRLMRTLGKNSHFTELPHFLGAGMYHHYIPPEVRSIASRAEFLTAYTPYQSEASQGMLQAMFEFQSMVCLLTEMDAANISMYDGATALAEATLMASRITGREEVLVPRHTLPDRTGTVRAYCEGPGIRIVEYGYDKRTGQADMADLERKVTDKTAAIVLENPNFFGMFEERATDVAALAHREGALSIVNVNPISLGLVKGPGSYGADIVVGEGQALGQGPSFGGPALGLFACRKEHLRMMPGRIVGQTQDKNGQRAFCLTLQTREQHIRRDKATSNICTNEGLNALMATLYLAMVGGKGLRRIARLNASRAKHLAERVGAVRGFKVPFAGFTFNEFVVQCPKPVATVNEALLAKHGLWGGLDLSAQFPELGNAMLLCVTELHAQESIDSLVQGLQEVAA